MKLKIYNKTTIPDDVVGPLIHKAAIAAKIKSCIVVIRKGNYSGYANQGSAFKEPSIFGHRRWMKYNGMITIKLKSIDRLRPWGSKSTDEWHIHRSEKIISCVKHLWEILLHEYSHTIDDKLWTATSEDYSHKWRNRPHEIRAENMKDEMLKRWPQSRVSNLLDDLGSWLLTFDVKSKRD